uniref:glutathione transferase n=1 Tax=Serinus canaria TaxID=9135 RepID=A0A8C9MJ25_SERCA
MGLELYLDLLSQPCRSIYIFARSNNIPFEFKHVELFKDSVLGKKPAAGSGAEQPRAGPSNSEGAGKVSLLKKVPALKDGDFTLAECTAILLYLSRKYNTPDHWYPSDIQQRARVDEYLSWHHANIRASAPKTMWIKVLIPLFTGQPLPSEKLQEVMEGLSTSLKQFEERFLQDKAFIIGSEISLADLVAIVELMQVSAWSMVRKLSTRKTDAAEQGRGSMWELFTSRRSEAIFWQNWPKTMGRMWEWVQNSNENQKKSWFRSLATDLFCFSSVAMTFSSFFIMTLFLTSREGGNIYK